MDSLRLWARDGEAVRQAIELGEIAHIETASEELTDEFLLFAIESGLLQTWAEAFPDPRDAPEIGMGAAIPAHSFATSCHIKHILAADVKHILASQKQYARGGCCALR